MLPGGDPRKNVTFDPGTLSPHDHGKKRVGKPRLHWYMTTVQEFWDVEVKACRKNAWIGLLDISEGRHVTMIRNTARALNEALGS